MTGNRAYQQMAAQYRRQDLETATPERVLILLYEGAIRFLGVAEKAMGENDIGKSHTHLIKAQHIIREFMNTLDFEIGGETARNLYNLYEYLHYRLVQANLQKEVAAIVEVRDHLKQLKATWEEAIVLAQREAATRQNPEDSGAPSAATA